ncbi:hypothetical protein ACFLRA_00825 [Bdellovibrionota bacterium]
MANLLKKLCLFFCFIFIAANANGQCPPATGQCGDFDGIGGVGILDALSLSQTAAGFPNTQYSCDNYGNVLRACGRGDVNGDGRISVIDALQAAIKASGRTTQENCPSNPFTAYKDGSRPFPVNCFQSMYRGRPYCIVHPVNNPVGSTSYTTPVDIFMVSEGTKDYDLEVKFDYFDPVTGAQKRDVTFVGHPAGSLHHIVTPGHINLEWDICHDFWVLLNKCATPAAYCSNIWVTVLDPITGSVVVDPVSGLDVECHASSCVWVPIPPNPYDPTGARQCP